MVRNVFWGLTIKDEVTHIKPKVSFKITKVNKPRQSNLDVRSKRFISGLLRPRLHEVERDDNDPHLAEEGGAKRIRDHL